MVSPISGEVSRSDRGADRQISQTLLSGSALENFKGKIFMKEEKRLREKQIKFRVTEQELGVIKRRKDMMHFPNMECYLRRVALGEPLYNIDTTSIDAIAKDVEGISRNINQIARRINSTDTAYAEDLRQIKQQQDKIMELLQQAFSKLLSLRLIKRRK